MSDSSLIQLEPAFEIWSPAPEKLTHGLLMLSDPVPHIRAAELIVLRAGPFWYSYLGQGEPASMYRSRTILRLPNGSAIVSADRGELFPIDVGLEADRSWRGIFDLTAPGDIVY